MDGIRGFYQGFFVSVIYMIAGRAVQFGFYDTAKGTLF
jgi:hypothetical protein